jgi:hypothetical protein
MSSFEDWLETVNNPSVVKYSSRLVELGASWETFERGKDDTTADLVDAGIPLLAAKSIFNVAAQALKTRKQPLSIFWDLENVPIPANSTGIEVVSRLKSILASFGDLVQFRGYASIGLNHIPEQKRSELQLSGCDLVDCPHNGRKEVADKMIIVDAMEFAFTRIQEGATMCFITSDVDYAYLLAKLQRPQWRTIVISKGSRESMLQVNCDTKFQWETDVLQLNKSPSPPPGFHSAPLNASVMTIASSANSYLSATTACKPSASFNEVHEILPLKVQDNIETDNNVRTETKGSFSNTAACTRSNDENIKLLRSMIADYAHVGGGNNAGTLKCHVCSLLRQMYPSRFPDRSTLQQFISEAIECGAIIESTGQDNTKLLHLPGEFKGPTFSLSRVMPILLHEVPAKVQGLTSQLPFVLFLKKNHIPFGSKTPQKVLVQSSGKWMFLMFRNLSDAQHAIKSKPWLGSGVLIDWRKVENPKTNDDVVPIERFSCAICQKSVPVNESFIERDSDDCLCRLCFIGGSFWNTEEINKTSEKVVSMLQMMADNDDVFVPRGILRKSLLERWSTECSSRAQASLWIDVALDANTIHEGRRKVGKTKAKIMFLPENLKWTTMLFPEEKIDTTIEEGYVVDLLWKQGCLPRHEVINYLNQRFPHMNTPLIRSKLFYNATGTLFIAKNAYGQTVGLSIEDASSGLLKSNAETSAEEIPSVPESPTKAQEISDEISDSESENTIDEFNK